MIYILRIEGGYNTVNFHKTKDETMSLEEGLETPTTTKMHSVKTELNPGQNEERQTLDERKVY